MLLRGSRDFQDIKSYEEFLIKIITQRNNRRSKELELDLEHIRALPERHWNDPQIINVRVSPSSIISIKGVSYSVPSRLISYHLRAHIYSQYIDLYYANKKIETIMRITDSAGESKNNIDYRHIIDGLVRKPGAFANYKYRDFLFPSLIFRRAYDELVANNCQNGHKHYLKILQMAKCYGEVTVSQAIERCFNLRALPSPASIEALFKANKQSQFSTHCDVKVSKPNLKEYDNLYNLAEVA